MQVPANRIGYPGSLTLAQRKMTREGITPAVFVPFAVFHLGVPGKHDYLWAGLRLAGAVDFICR